MNVRPAEFAQLARLVGNGLAAGRRVAALVGRRLNANDRQRPQLAKLLESVRPDAYPVHRSVFVDEEPDALAVLSDCPSVGGQLDTKLCSFCFLGIRKLGSKRIA